MIELKSVEKIYSNAGVKTEALKNISLTIENGEFAAIMGPSGSGKSTLLKILGFMEEMTQGEYRLDGKDVSAITRKQMDIYRKENIAFVFQNFALMKERTVHENVELPLIARKIKRNIRKEKVKNVLKLLEIEELELKKVSHISGGQQQRCAMARAMITDAPYVLADEPTGALDSVTGMEIVKQLRRIADTGKTVIMVTHNEGLAEYADRIIRIKDGKLDEKMG